jgi:hypothetical protein
MHRYTFEPIDDNHVNLVIRPKSPDIELPHIITFGNFKDVIKEYVNVISRD